MLDQETQEVETVEIETEELEVEGDELETEEEAAEVEEEAGETDDTADDEGDDDTGEEETETAALTVTIEGEEPEEEDQSAGIRNLRQAHKEQKERIKELEAKLKEKQAPEAELGQKPKLEDFDYDAGKFEEALLSWNERKRAHDARQAEQQQQEEAARQRYLERLNGYNAKKQALGARDFDDAEEAVRDGLTVQQQSVIVANAERPELVVYALGKNPKVMQRLAEKKDDLVAFSYELAKLESNLKVSGMAKPKPEKRLKGSKGAAMTSQKKLEQLEAEAERTGDRTKVAAFKRELKRRQQAG